MPLKEQLAATANPLDLYEWVNQAAPLAYMDIRINEKFTYFLYARKSSESEDRQVQSIDDQINYFKKIAKDANLEIIEVFTEARSAKKPNNRPVFSEMIRRLERGEANGIVCWKLDRLARNPVDAGTITWLLEPKEFSTAICGLAAIAGHALKATEVVNGEYIVVCIAIRRDYICCVLQQFGNAVRYEPQGSFSIPRL